MQFTQYLDLTPSGDYEEIDITNAAVSRLNETYRTRSNLKGVLLTIESNSVRFRIDGGNPDANSGHVTLANGSIYIRDPFSIRELRLISTAVGGSRAIVTYYK